MKKSIFLSLVALLFSSLFSPVFASHNPNSNDDVPEKNGTYDDPGHPGVKVRVFVHPERPEKVTLSALACNLTDPQSTEPVSPSGWRLPSTVTYSLNPGSTPSSVGSVNMATIVQNGFNDWTAASGNKVTFVRGANTTVDRSKYDNKNIIAWGRTSGSALGVTYVRYYPSTGTVVDVDTIMNKKYAWKWANSSSCAHTEAYDAENIMTHELGHWLGLDDEYDEPVFQHATMYGYGAKGEVKKNTLTTSDALGAYTIYNP